jgi:hypothetical protein
MSRTEEILSELAAAPRWRREELLEQHGRFYGEGFAAVLRRQVEAEIKRKGDGRNE